MAISPVSGDVDLGAAISGVTSVTFSNITPISGNLLVVCVSNQQGGQTWPTAPTGWNYVIAGNTGGDFQSAMLYKVSDGTETGCDLGDIGGATSKLVALQFEGNATSGVLDDAAQDVTNYTTAAQTCPTGTATATQADGAAVAFTSWEDQRLAADGTHTFSNSFTILSDADPSLYPVTTTSVTHNVVSFLAYSSTGNYSTTDTTSGTGDENYGIIALFKAASGGGGVTGTIAATETGDDTAALAGAVLVAGSLAGTESGADTAALAGVVVVAGALAATESGDDTAAISGSQTITGTLAAVESGDDAAALAGTVLVAGSIAATEAGADTAALSGSVLVEGALAATESGDDTAAINGSSTVITTGTVAATETGDDATAITGAVLVAGLLAAVETGEDTAGLAGQIFVAGLVAASETGSDTASITSAAALSSTPERTYLLPAELRTLTLRPESRVYEVPPESRTWKARPS